MNKLKSFKEYEKLVHEMIQHDRHYYDETKPEISDYEYDQLMYLLRDYEKNHPEDILTNSPAQRVAEAPTQGFDQKNHLVPMMSLANTYSKEEVGDFLKRVYKLLETKEISFCCELKMDGTAISLRYKHGKLFSAVTRGNGKTGDDVTANIRTIKSVPLKLEGSGFPDDFEVRGEVYLSLASFHAINQDRQEAGLETFANPRNAAAGSLKLLDPSMVAKRKLHLLCYGIAEGLSPVRCHHKTLEALKSWGLPVADSKYVQLACSLDEIMSFAEKIQQQRSMLPFEIDGIVIKLDDLTKHLILGATGKTPRYAVAYKFAPEQASTCVLDITVQVGRTGVLTPVAELEPVFLAGSTISRATLHNQEEVARKDIRIGDTVIIEKGGDVIPKVVSVDLTKRPSHASVWHMPKNCPICHQKVIHKEGEVAVRCSNDNCLGQRMRKIAYFASKHAMDIEHMGEKVVEQLVEKSFVSRISDIYLLTENQLRNLEGFKEKSIQNLLESIEASKKCSFAKVIMGLGIPSVGVETAEAIAEYARDFPFLLKMTEENFREIEGIGEKTSHVVYAFFQDEENRREIHDLLSHGVCPQKMKEKIQGHIFSGKTFVLTGALKNYSRDEAAAMIKERGGKVSGSVSKKTDFVLVGEDPGSKYSKALELGVQILSEEQFAKMC